MTPKESLFSALATMPNRHHTETRLQAAVASVIENFNHEGYIARHCPEVKLSDDDRIDFLATVDGDGFGIECKTAGSALAIQRQLYRYARHLPELVLLSAKATGIQSGIITAENGNKCLLHVFELWKNPT